MKKVFKIFFSLVLVANCTLAQDDVDDINFERFDKKRDFHSTMSENYLLNVDIDKSLSYITEVDLTPDSLSRWSLLYVSGAYIKTEDVAQLYKNKKEIQIIGVALLMKRNETYEIPPSYIGVATNYKKFLDSVEIPQYTLSKYDYVELFFENAVTVSTDFYVKISMPKAYLKDEKMYSLFTSNPQNFTIFFEKKIKVCNTKIYEVDVDYYGSYQYWSIMDASFMLYMFPIMAEDRASYEQSVGIEDNEPNLWISVFPNPASETLQIQSPFKIIEAETVNSLGQSIEIKQVNGNSAVLDVSNYNKGVYIVNIRTQYGITKKKFVVS